MRQYGIIHTPTGLVDVVVQNLREGKTVEIAESRDETGKVIDMKAYSVGRTFNCDGLMNAADVESVKPGAIMECNGENYLIDSREKAWENAGFAKCSLSGKGADNAELHPYDDGSSN